MVERQKEQVERTDAKHRLAQLRAAHQAAIAQEATASAEALDAAAKAATATETVRQLKQRASAAARDAKAAGKRLTTFTQASGATCPAG